jgi:hypothetical protein
MDVIAWLLDADPAIRWQTMRDLAHGDADAERARVAGTGLGAEILRRQDRDGGWSMQGEPQWVPTLYTASLLATIGADPRDPRVADAVSRLASGFHWHPSLGGKPFFEGEIEPCINGGTLRIGSLLGRPSEALANRLLGEQLADGGWNCEAPKSMRSSFHSTICVLEGLLAYERATGANVTAARQRGEQYLIDRGMYRRRSTGAVASEAFLAFAFPTRCWYDVLRGLDYLRAAGAAPVPEAVRLVEQRRQPDGTWLLDASHPDGLDFPIGEQVGAPSRWNTLRAMRVLRWAA